MKRTDWKRVHKSMKKSSLSEFKEVMNSLIISSEKKAYEKAITEGVKDLRISLMSDIKQILKSEYGIGDKRFIKFESKFLELPIDLDVQTSFTKELPNDLAVTNSEKVYLIILFQIGKLIDELFDLDEQDSLFMDKDIRKTVLRIKHEVNELEHISKLKLNYSHFNDIRKKVVEKNLILQDEQWDQEEHDTITYKAQEMFELFEEVSKKVCLNNCSIESKHDCNLRDKFIKHNIPVNDPECLKGCEYR